MDYKDNNGKIVGEATAINAYFRRPEETLMQMHNQIKELSPADKSELAAGAAKELGWTEVK